MLESPDGVDEGMMHESLEEEVSVVLGTLKDREKEVLKMCYGIGGESEMDLSEIAEKFGLSRDRTRQIRDKAIRRLRHESRSDMLRHYLGQEKQK